MRRSQLRIAAAGVCLQSDMRSPHPVVPLSTELRHIHAGQSVPAFVPDRIRSAAAAAAAVTVHAADRIFPAFQDRRSAAYSVFWYAAVPRSGTARSAPAVRVCPGVHYRLFPSHLHSCGSPRRSLAPVEAAPALLCPRCIWIFSDDTRRFSDGC